MAPAQAGGARLRRGGPGGRRSQPALARGHRGAELGGRRGVGGPRDQRCGAGAHRRVPRARGAAAADRPGRSLVGTAGVA